MSKLFWTLVAMLKLMILLGLVVVFTGCGVKKKSVPLTEGYTTIELESMVNDIRSQYPEIPEYYVNHIAIVKDLKVEGVSNPAGVCKIYETGEPIELLIDGDYWNRSDKEAKLGVLIHELGHCDWNLDHSDKGIMHPHAHVSAAEVRKNGILDSLLFMLGYL